MLLARHQVIAHRGSSYAAPENTLCSLKKALDEGIGAVEFDISLSRDNVPFLHHDDTFLRCAGLDTPVRALDFETIARLDVGRWFNPIFSGEAPPSLENALKLLVPAGVGIILDIKTMPTNLKSDYIRTIHKVTNGYNELEKRLIYSSFDPAMIDEINHQGISGEKALIVDNLPEDWLPQAKSLKVSAIHVNIDYITRPQIRHIKMMGFAVRAYTVNNPNRLNIFLPETFDAIFTDCPPMFLNKALGE